MSDAGSASVNRTKLVIMMPWGRVGSNLLLSMFASAFRGTAHEMANEPFDRDWTNAERMQWYESFHGGGTRTGLTVSKHNIRAIAEPAELYPVFESLGLQLVRMRRANLVRVAISVLRARQHAEATEKASGTPLWGVPVDQTPPPPEPLDPKAFVRALKYVAEADEKLLAFAPSCPTFDLEYAEFKKDLEGGFGRLCDWLGLDPPESAEPAFRKATPEDIFAAIPNLDRLREAVREAALERFEPMFDQ